MLTTALNVRNAPRNASDATHTLYITSFFISSLKRGFGVGVLLNKNFLLISSLSLYSKFEKDLKKKDFKIFQVKLKTLTVYFLTSDATHALYITSFFMSWLKRGFGVGVLLKKNFLLIFSLSLFQNLKRFLISKKISKFFR
jgi:flagellar biosynthesis protein FliP